MLVQWMGRSLLGSGRGDNGQPARASKEERVLGGDLSEE